MAGNGHGTESPIELLRQLIEQSGKWTEELVLFTRQMLVGLVILTLFFGYIFARLILDLLSGGGIRVIPLILGPITAYYLATGLVRYQRIYRNRVSRRDEWRRKFEILRKKEEDIQKLLSDEAG